MKKRVLFIFLDGVGIGAASEHNPFYVAGSGYLPFYTGAPGLPDGTPIKPIDAVMGVDGLPQSATGQTTMFTGENIPLLMNEHKGSYPNQMQRKILLEKNIIKRLRARNLAAFFINAYPFYAHLFGNGHVDILEDGSFHFSHEFPPLFKRRISTTTCMMISCGLIPFDAAAIVAEKSIYQDYTNESLNRMLAEAVAAGGGDLTGKEVPLPEFTPEKAAEILVKAFRTTDFSLYEYFQTDLYGHRHTFAERVELIEKLGRFIGTVLSLMDKEQETLLITSDHGNLEDGTSSGHTRNPVPLIVWGNESDGLRNSITSLTDITPTIEAFFSH